MSKIKPEAVPAAAVSETAPAETPAAGAPERPEPPKQPPGEIGGPRGLEPTRFGDWECKGRGSDF